eukprot:12429207-Karenia_brevis.AAC.1
MAEFAGQIGIRNSQFEQRLSNLERRMDETQNDNRENATSLGIVREQLQMDYTTQHESPDSSWDRRPDLTVLRASAIINFSRDALKEACAPWLGANFQDNQYDFIGPETGIAKNWGIKFRGNPSI